MGGLKEIVKSTTNRGEFNRAYKMHLEHSGKIHCSRCGYHRGENENNNYYGGYKKTNGQWSITYPNWKLVSKKPKQWMKKPIKIVHEIMHNREYVEIKF